MKQKVTIEDMQNDYCIYDESGHLIEDGFMNYEDAETWANENDYEVVHLFNTAPSTLVEDKQTESNKQPLYKVLNEQRTQGTWVSNDYSESNIFEPHFEVSSPENKRRVFDTPVVESEDAANAQYTALAVNNLHILAEALEKIACFDGVYRDAAERADIAKRALKNIS